MAIRQLYPFLLVALLSSCALIIDPLENNLPPFQKIEKPTIGTLLVPELANLQTANKKKPILQTTMSAPGQGSRHSCLDNCFSSFC